VHAAAGNEKKRSINMVEHDASTNQPVLTTTQLANQRTDLALLRTCMAADRTLMAWVRTALSMISFGFTIYKFLQDVNRYVRENGGVGIREQGPRNLGLSLLRIGHRRIAACAHPALEAAEGAERWKTPEVRVVSLANHRLHHLTHWVDDLPERAVEPRTFLARLRSHD
jgi:uncharacterized membrane protein YidH (DUF202 family)